MVRGLYTAASGAVVAQANVDIIANNLANADTNGFKRTLMQVQAAPQTSIYRDQTDPGREVVNRTRGVAAHEYLGTLGAGAQVYDTPTVFDQGAIAQTGNAADVALSGPGFLAVSNASGATSYVRSVSLQRNSQGTLVTASGERVLGSDGRPLVLSSNAPFQIDRSGAITVNGASAGRLGVYEFSNPSAVRAQGAGQFVNAGSAVKAATGTTVLQGAQEKSNANVVSSMVDLITSQRWFEANEKMIQTQDSTTGVAVQTVGKTTQ